MAHQSTDHCVWNCLESVRGVPYKLSNNTAQRPSSDTKTYNIIQFTLSFIIYEWMDDSLQGPKIHYIT